MTRRISLWSLAVFVLVAALSFSGWAVMRNGVARQDEALLRGDESQLISILQATLQNLRNQLDGVVFYSLAAPNEATVFAEEAKPILTSPTISVALVSVSPPRVLLAKGPDLRDGEPLPSDLVTQSVATLAKTTTPPLDATIFRSGSKTLLAITSALVVYPHDAAIQTEELNQTGAAPDLSGPYSHLFVNIYNSTKPVRSQLLITTYGPGPLPGPVANEVVRYEGVTWLVQASQRSALVGTYAQNAPWIALAVGLLVAFALASAVELLARRERDAAVLVAETKAELLESQKHIVRNERLAAVGQMATVIGHELRNPLGSAINSIHLAKTSPTDMEKYLSVAEKAVYRAAKLSEDLTTYMREREPVFSDIQFESLVSEVLESVPAPPDTNVSVEGSLTLRADRTLMTQVLTNVITNAYQAMPHGGTLRISVDQEGQTTAIRVRDSGSGFDPAIAEQLFDPFFTTKEDGTGLGLAIVQRLVQLQGGTIDVDNGHLEGAIVSIRLPAA
ncbi:MAG TPA: ATP-binding protein [Acidimicrobiales bacterium]|nr:ATP-binding protein [Acidimicrobiales bacterium]